MADQRGQRSNIGVARSEATVLVSLEHKPEVHSVPSGEDLTELLLERFHRKVGSLASRQILAKCPKGSAGQIQRQRESCTIVRGFFSN
jgi:hypothetical protein